MCHLELFITVTSRILRANQPLEKEKLFLKLPRNEEVWRREELKTVAHLNYCLVGTLRRGATRGQIASCSFVGLFTEQMREQASA